MDSAMMDLARRCRIACGAPPRGASSGPDALLQDRSPAVFEACPSEECQDQTIVAHTLFNAVGLQVLVVDTPAGISYDPHLPATNAFADCGNVGAGTIFQPRCELLSIARRNLRIDFPVQEQPAAVCRRRR